MTQEEADSANIGDLVISDCGRTWRIEYPVVGMLDAKVFGFRISHYPEPMLDTQKEPVWLFFLTRELELCQQAEPKLECLY